ncbi:carbohydrate ABC transporter permease [Microlunatus panaciterrae]|uniref:Multiple sugar transport system permease protein n=1 Tax=Microlunatus panaciterrae TaxID=400768 RepID=A0ABS2RN03_9ACTN|nr:carbohydrate ABC transporter permease [Microlunatus panaciterrae]MBM7800398.1 multiple sugar transport system permease protein [Microlunatus panaciterrae]
MTTISTLGANAVETVAHEKDVRTRRPFKWTQIPLHLILAVGAVGMALPFAWMVFSSFKPLGEIFLQPPKLLPIQWAPENYTNALAGANFGRAFFNSIYISLTVVVVSLFTCAMAAYGFARIRFPGNNLLFTIFLATLMVPGQLTVIPLYIIMSKIGWVDTHLALIVPPALFSAFGVFLLRQYVRGIPIELEEAAAIDGAGRIRSFFTIILPLLRTPMVALGIFTFLAQWNNFFYALIFLNTEDNFTIPLLVNQFKGQYSSDWTGLMAAATLAAAPLLIVFIIAQRQIVEGIALSGSKT